MSETDYRELMGKTYLGAWDLSDNKDLILTINRVEGGNVENEQHETAERPLIYFNEIEKPMVCNNINGETISKIAGTRIIEKWKGVRIALYPDHKVKAFGKLHDAIRVRPYAPKLDATNLVCADCGKPISDHGKFSATNIAESSRGTYGRTLCWDCAQKAKEKADAKAKESDVL